MHMVWAIDPTISGPATVLIDANERRVVAWLNNRFDLDLDAVQPHGRSFKLWARDLIVRGTVLGIRGVLAEAKVARRIGVAKARDATVQFAERRRLLRDQRIANDVSVQRPPAGKTKLQPVLAERAHEIVRPDRIIQHEEHR